MDEDSKQEGSDNSKEIEVSQLVDNGMRLIRQGEFQDAIRHFRNKEAAKSAGFLYRVGRSHIVSASQNQEGIEQLVEGSALDSYFMHDPDPSITLADVAVLQLSESIPVELPQSVYQNVALVHAEEWLHGLQFLKKKPLAGYEDPEIDVAFYLHDHKVLLTGNFLKRHGRNAFPILKETIDDRED